MFLGMGSPTAKTNRNGTVTITGIPVQPFTRYMHKYYNVVNFVERIFIAQGWWSYTFYEFFVPEMIFLLDEFSKRFRSQRAVCLKLIDELYKHTWFGSSLEDVKTGCDYEGMLQNITFKPLPHQEAFVKDIYWQKKIQYHLRGYLMAWEMGGGKTKGSLMTAEALHKRHVIVTCPLSTLRNVWVPEIQSAFKVMKKIWTIKDPIEQLTADTEYIVINYENIAKITSTVVKLFDSKDIIMIVDECHNFKDINALRTKNLVDLVTTADIQDILLLSGTPVKAWGTEALPVLRLLDSYFNDQVREQIKSLNRYNTLMNDLMHRRLGLMMHRVKREEVMTLPEKHVADLLVKLKDGDKYTLDSVKRIIETFTDERKKYYAARLSVYEEKYQSCLRKFAATLNGTEERKRYDWYVRSVNKIKVTKFFLPEDYELIHQVNIYEKEVIEPRLSGSDRKVFRDAKTVVKYVQLKILGEVLGRVLNQLRIEMTSKMIENNQKVFRLIREAEKKTIIFTSYKDTISVAQQAFAQAGFKAVAITGDNSNEAKNVVEQFTNTPELNPLICTIQSMSTGHTILAANTVFFLNVPFRDVDFQQASDRCYRYGQDAEVYIYKLILDTGDEPNLSTRMSDIMAWSKQQFDNIVDGVEVPVKTLIDIHRFMDQTDDTSAVATYIKEKFEQDGLVKSLLFKL